MLINGQKLDVRRYSSGELKFVRSELDKYIDNNRVKVVYENEYSVFELILVLKYYLNKDVLVDLVLGYLPYQRMDHMGRDELDTVSYVANIFNNLNLNSIVICEPHCDVGVFSNCSKVSLVEKMKDRVFEEINFNQTNDIVVLADKGGLKRYANIARNIVYFEKKRDENTGLIIEYNIVGSLNKDCKAVIVDDIVSTGDTIVNIIEKLIEDGIKEIYLLVGHYEVNKYNERIFEFEEIKKVFSSNSLTKNSRDKLKLYNISELI